ncbi:MAG: ATP-binding protein [Acidimicrobiales bacterium]
MAPRPWKYPTPASGIPVGEQPHLFERFWRGRAAAGSERSGIGLAIAAELAAAHGGTIRVRSSEGEGGSFVLSLPSASP